MRRRGFTFIELMISAAIMAGVLITAFTVYAIINRNGRTAQRLRSDSNDAATLVSMLRDYGRYAAPWLDDADQPICTSGGLSSEQLAALKTGVSASSNTTWLAVRKADAVGTTKGYMLYGFTFVDTGLVTTTVGTRQSYIPQYNAVAVTNVGAGVCAPTPQASDLSLLPDNLRVVRDPAQPMITNTAATSTNGGSVGPVSLTISPNRVPHSVEIHFAVINTQYPNQAPLEYLTSFTPRTYSSEFVAL